MIPNLTAILTADTPTHAICGDNVFRTFKDTAGDVGPFIVWEIVSGLPENNLSARPDIDDARLRVNAYSKVQREARALSEAAQYALETLGDVVFGPTEEYETETLLWRRIFDIELWTARA